MSNLRRMEQHIKQILSKMKISLIVLMAHIFHWYFQIQVTYLSINTNLFMVLNQKLAAGFLQWTRLSSIYMNQENWVATVFQKFQKSGSTVWFAGAGLMLRRKKQHVRSIFLINFYRWRISRDVPFRFKSEVRNDSLRSYHGWKQCFHWSILPGSLTNIKLWELFKPKLRQLSWQNVHELR